MCNCGKRRKASPSSSSLPSPASPPSPTAPAPASPPVSPLPTTQPPTSATASLTTQTQSFAYVPPAIPGGVPQVYGSRLEAEAARVRSGRVGQVLPLL